MAGIEKRMASTIFSKCGVESKGDIIVISLTFVELCGNKINDLLIKGSSGVKVLDIKALDLDDGTVRLLNASVIEVKSPEELLDQILLAKGRRATEATDMNGVSSRSHAVCQIEIKSKHPSSSNNRGLLTLIDCAGSERSHDSLYHSSERQKESAEINASLYALKECIRAKSKNARIPFRSSNLTRILKESFERDGARLCVIACVAPNATDTEHTMETLKTASTVVGVEDQIKEELAHEVVLQQRTMKEVALPPSAWDHQQLKTFLTKNKLERVVLLTQKHDGRKLMKMSVLQMRAQLFDDKDKEFAQTLFDLLRKENDRVAVIQRKERVNNKLNRKGSV
jgi:kinesin family protein 2/24